MRRVAITGFVIWAAATIALRLAGQFVFRSPLPLFLVSLPAMIFVTCAVLVRFRTSRERALAAIVLVAPGMLLDTISAAWFSSIFPNIRPDAAALFGGWLLFCNVVVLLTAISTGSGEERLDRRGSVIEDSL
jgi:cytochrome bd-type quinol oxidase subunit 2